MKSLSGKLGVILIGLAIFGYAEVWGADWKLYGTDANVLTYYDAESITRPSENIVRVWVRWDYTEKGVSDWVRTFGKEYENLSHTISLWEINCSEKKNRGLSLVDYDHKGDVIPSIHSPGEWKFIFPDSIGESLYKKVCK
jgi:hypothetical protein